jgi:hypothetical protein
VIKLPDTPLRRIREFIWHISRKSGLPLADFRKKQDLLGLKMKQKNNKSFGNNGGRCIWDLIYLLIETKNSKKLNFR